MLHHKSFFTFQRFAQTDPICQNSRIRQLNSYFHFDERIVVDQNIPSDLLNYDYNSFEEILCKEREKSMNYLKQSLR